MKVPPSLFHQISSSHSNVVGLGINRSSVFAVAYLKHSRLLLEWILAVGCRAQSSPLASRIAKKASLSTSFPVASTADRWSAMFKLYLWHLAALCVGSVVGDDDNPVTAITTAPIYLPHYNAESWSLVRGSIVDRVWTLKSERSDMWLIVII